jgi:sortase A
VLFFAWARAKWGQWQSWAVGLPLMLATGWAVANQLAALLPNLL